MFGRTPAIFKNCQFYHGSRYPLLSGTILLPNTGSVVDELEVAVENVLERFRPSHALPRYRSVYMLDSPDVDAIERAGGQSQHVYRVCPRGSVSRNDVHWWAEILDGGALNVHGVGWHDPEARRFLKSLRTMATSYWRGEASSRPLWEYRAASAVVKERV